MTEKPFSPACERNREPIAALLRDYLAACRSVLEIGSGTGQHAVHFAAAMPWLEWQSADCAAQLPGICAWLDEAALPNTPPPLVLDVDGGWPARCFDAVFTANTLHILAWPQVERLFATVPGVLAPGAMLIVYGPFHEGGRPTSAGNATFDLALRAEAPHMGIRDRAAVAELARAAGLELAAVHAMPANNLCLVWRKPPS